MKQLKADDKKWNSNKFICFNNCWNLI